MIDDTTKPALAILQPDWDSVRPANVDALMTLRAGGVSSGPFGDKDGIGGFNVGLYTGDVPVCVNMNRNLAAQLVPADPKWLKQVHGDRVVDAETAAPEEEADASSAITPNVVCVVQVADCLPVLIAEKNGRAVAAVHCGWGEASRQESFKKPSPVCVKDSLTLTRNLSRGLDRVSVMKISKRVPMYLNPCKKSLKAPKWLSKKRATASISAL